MVWSVWNPLVFKHLNIEDVGITWIQTAVRGSEIASTPSQLSGKAQWSLSLRHSHSLNQNPTITILRNCVFGSWFWFSLFLFCYTIPHGPCHPQVALPRHFIFLMQLIIWWLCGASGPDHQVTGHIPLSALDQDQRADRQVAFLIPLCPLNHPGSDIVCWLVGTTGSGAASGEGCRPQGREEEGGRCLHRMSAGAEWSSVQPQAGVFGGLIGADVAFQQRDAVRFHFHAYLMCFFFKSSSYCSILYTLFVAIKHTCFEITLCNMAHP